MRNLISFFLILFGLMSSGFLAHAKSSKKSDKNLSFDEILVRGKHHFNSEAVVTVEQDKVLNALLEVRKDFKDRIKRTKVQY